MLKVIIGFEFVCSIYISAWSLKEKQSECVRQKFVCEKTLTLTSLVEVEWHELWNAREERGMTWIVEL